MVKVTIKFGKKKHKNVEIKDTDSFDDIQGIIFSLTQVAPDRQKIIIKGKRLENDDGIKKLIKKGALLTVMGSSASAQSTASSGTTIKFVEEMTEAEKQMANTELPPGMANLGNTCYLNSCIQAMKSVDELRQRLKEHAAKSPNQNSMSSQLGHLMLQLEQNSDSIVPQQFVQYFRTALPRFASRNDNGVWEQQDADEAYTEILSLLRQDASFVMDDDEKTSVVGRLFEGEFETKTVCAETEEEPELNVTEKFVKLQCFIDINTRHINDGIKKGFAENLEKNSPKLGRNAVWRKTKAMSALPRYMAVQLVRFFWKQKTQKNAKILRKVMFPVERLDVYDFCNEALRKNIERYRRLRLEQEDREREQRQRVEVEEKKKKEEEKGKGGGDGKEKGNEEQEAVDKEEDPETKEEAKGDDDGDGGDSTESDQMDVDESAETELVTGYYELCGIVTHKGRSANSGHYIGYSKDTARGQWLKFDDEDVTEIKSDDIKQLYGGGDFQMAFLCIFRRIECEKV